MTIMDFKYLISDPTNNILVYITDSIYNGNPGFITRGRATDFGIAKIALAKAGDGYTLAHEIGHGKFSLKHPDNDDQHLILTEERDKEVSPIGGPYKYSDKNNFMYSTTTGRVNRIRHYQWKKIMTGRYKN